MNPISLIVFAICGVALLIVPRKWAPAALLAGSIYMTLGQGIEIASIRLPVYRMMLLVGLLRVIIKGETLPGGLNLIDKLVIGWSFWAIFASLFHDQERYGIIFALGNVFNLSMIYFLIRIWCTDIDEVRDIVIFVAFLLVPIAIEMIMEKVTGKNLFSVFGGVPENVAIREGKLRAQGPFLHAILAGTVGATCVPLFIGLLSSYRVAAIVGIVAGVVMTFASASSGPVMSLLAGLGAVMLWRYRAHLHKLRLAAVLAYLVLMVTMKQPPYYLISRIDISGGSTGWHRSFLIEQTFKHLSEWWLFGTDVTRHWMPMQGIAHDPQHTDITNYYIGFGVFAGLPSMLAIIAILLIAFSWVGKILNKWGDVDPERGFMIFCFGAALFSHAATSISVAYFDQSMLFFWLTVAVISSIYSITHSSPEEVLIYPDDDPFLGETGQVNPAVENAEWRRRLREKMNQEETRSLNEGG
jgi:hypothetical protein